jgi:hypothetical protein
MILQVLIAMVAGWLQRDQQQVIAYLLAENRVLNAQLRGRPLRLTDAERRRLAALAQPVVPVDSKQPKFLTLFPLGLTLDRSTFAYPDAL